MKPEPGYLGRSSERDVVIDVDRPWGRLSKRHRGLLLTGTEDRPFTVTYENRFGIMRGPYGQS